MGNQDSLLTDFILLGSIATHQQNDKKLAAFLGFSACRQAHKLLTSVPFSQMSRF
jgi:hypothetical protein